MRKLIIVALLTAAPVFTLGSAPAEAFGCGWFGLGYRPAMYSYAPAPRTYSYAPARRYYYAPTRRYYGPRVYYGRTLYRPRVARGYGYRAAWRGGRRWR